MTIRRWFHALAFGAAVMAATPAFAQGVEPVEAYRDWRVFTFAEDGNTGCFIYTEPTSSDVNGLSDRGTPSLQVTSRPWADRNAEVSVSLGYEAADGVNPTAEIGSTEVPMFAEGGTAWAATAEDDQVLIRAMRAGLDMEVSAQADGGGRSTDTFSLRGFTNALNKMNEVCG